jgi:hypothetical protein
LSGDSVADYESGTVGRPLDDVEIRLSEQQELLIRSRSVIVVCQTVCHRSAVGGIKWEKAGSGGNKRQIAALRGGTWKSALTAGLS